MSILSVFESERLIESLTPIDLTDVGSPAWLAQADAVHRLSAQAHLDALTHHDEYIVDCLLLHDRLPVLVHQLLTVEAYHVQVVPQLLGRLSQLQRLRLYLLLFHQATLINLVECLAFHPQVLLHLADDALIELTDYCHRRILTLHTPSTSPTLCPASSCSSSPDDDDDDDGDERIRAQMADIGFACAACCVSVLRYITDHIDALPLSVSARLVQGHDTLGLLLPLLLHSPFTRTPPPPTPSSSPSPSATLKWVDQRWTPIPPTDLPLLTRTEGQVWLAVSNLLVSRTALARSEWWREEGVRRMVGEVGRLMGEVLLDQLPVLVAMKRRVEEVGMGVGGVGGGGGGGGVGGRGGVAVEVVAEMREGIMRGRVWAEVARLNFERWWMKGEEEARAEMRGMTEGWGGGVGLGGVPVCGECGGEADKRCSLCAEVWYCGRECQVKGWKAHRVLCEERREERRRKEAERQRRDGAKAKEKEAEQAALDAERDKPWKQSAPHRPLIELLSP